MWYTLCSDGVPTAYAVTAAGCTIFTVKLKYLIMKIEFRELRFFDGESPPL